MKFARLMQSGATEVTEGSEASYSTGLSSVLDTVSGENDAWTQHTVDISDFAGATGYLVFEYINGSGFRGDIQLDAINLDGTTASFESGVDSYEAETQNSATYGGVTWSTLTSNLSSGTWSRDSGGTGSSGTGRTDAASGTFYVYAETSGAGSADGYKFWLRGPLTTLSSSPTLSYYEARLGANIGTLNVYLFITE